MFRNYSPLPFVTLPQGTSYAQPTQITPDRVQLDSPAIDVMTDLAHVAAVIVLASDSIDEAHRRMLQRHVRLLLVVDQERKVMGVISSVDIAGERPVQVAVERGIRHDEVLVRNVMIPRRNLQVLNLEEVRTAKVGHIVATLRLAGRQHILVIDRSVMGDVQLRGIFSATQIFRQLDMPFQPDILANTFAEIEAQLMH